MKYHTNNATWSVHCHSWGMKPFSYPYGVLVTTIRWITEQEAGRSAILISGEAPHGLDRRGKGSFPWPKLQSKRQRQGLAFALLYWKRLCKLFYPGQRDACYSLWMFDNVLFVVLNLENTLKSPRHHMKYIFSEAFRKWTNEPHNPYTFPSLLWPQV